MNATTTAPSVTIPAPAPEKRHTRRDEYRGNPLLVIPLGRDRDFSFGVGKARAILEYLDDVRAFVAEHSEPRIEVQ